MIQKATEPPPRPAQALTSEAAALLMAEHSENLSLQMRIDALRACLVAIARGVDHPAFAAVKALSSDDDMHAAFRIARGLHK